MKSRLALAYPLLAFLLLNGCHTSEEHITADASLLLPESALPEFEQRLDHAALITAWGEEEDAFIRGEKIYGNVCFNCHGNSDQPGSLPDAFRFWEDSFKHGNDPYRMYQTITRGYGLMPPQVRLSPKQKYEVIHYIREAILKEENPGQYVEVDEAYLASLPPGDSLGPADFKWRPYRTLDYGNFLTYTYELVDAGAPERNISGGPSPLPNEDLSRSNIVQKGMAVRLDEGEGGIAAGKAWMVMDQDLLQVGGAWTGEGFIDWRAILFNGEHNIYPRTIGKLHFENSPAPGWAHPRTGSWIDPRIRGLDGRQFGPLPRDWAHYKGLYYHQGKVVFKYTVGASTIYEMFGLEYSSAEPVFTRTLNITPDIEDQLIMRVAPADVPVALVGAGASLISENGYHMLKVNSDRPQKIKILIGTGSNTVLEAYAGKTAPPRALANFTEGGPAHYPETITSPITSGGDEQAYVMDVLHLPQNSPWNSRFQLSGIDFDEEDPDQAYVCSVEGDVWHLSGITQQLGDITWRRIASGLFQPLGIKVHQGSIYVSCRDQLAVLRDLNGDGETDYYESFNNDHQVTEHFHEFAMGLQVDEAGNFYYAKSARHARTPLVPQHGTLLRVSADGKETEIVAHGFRAANGVCINPDGSFIVTDQQGHWNPMNRLNWVEEGRFYGNMYGYGAPADSSDAAMEHPFVWVDMKYDRSPSELLWADSDRWGPLGGSLLNFSYGYGKVYVVPHEEVEGVMQGGLIEIPIPQFATGVMRGRFNPGDGQLYACGLSSWATNQVLQEGGLYRVRYTGEEIQLPVRLNVFEDGLVLGFSGPLDPESVADPGNFEIETWGLKRTRRYGSDRFDRKSLQVENSQLAGDGSSVLLELDNLEPTWVMEIKYRLKTTKGRLVEGALQNTIHRIPRESMTPFQGQ